MTSYKNPSQAVQQRNAITRHGEVYNLMLLRIHTGARSENPRVYDGNHHSIKTRNSRVHYTTCNLNTAKTYARKDLQTTEEAFFQLAVNLNLADTNSNTIIPVYFSELEELSSKISKSRKPKLPVSSQAVQSNPVLNGNGFPNQMWASNNPHFFSPYQPYPPQFPSQMGMQMYPSSHCYGNFYGCQSPMISTAPSPMRVENDLSHRVTLDHEAEVGEERKADNIEIPKETGKLSELEKLVLTLADGQKQMQNQLSGVISFVNNATSKPKRAAKPVKLKSEPNLSPNLNYLRNQREEGSLPTDKYLMQFDCIYIAFNLLSFAI